MSFKSYREKPLPGPDGSGNGALHQFGGGKRLRGVEYLLLRTSLRSRAGGLALAGIGFLRTGDEAGLIIS
jgi:hypothetical protein